MVDNIMCALYTIMVYGDYIMQLSIEVRKSFTEAQQAYQDFELGLKRNKRIIKNPKYNLELSKFIINYRASWFNVCKIYHTKKPPTKEHEQHILVAISKFHEVEELLKHLMFLARLEDS